MAAFILVRYWETSQNSAPKARTGMLAISYVITAYSLSSINLINGIKRSGRVLPGIFQRATKGSQLDDLIAQ